MQKLRWHKEVTDFFYLFSFLLLLHLQPGGSRSRQGLLAERTR
jgi:hypothetical protein